MRRKRECVLLIHGLGENAARMLPVSLALNFMGYRTLSITYPSTAYPAERLACEYIAPVLRDLEAEERLHIVTHSMGGILLRSCLEGGKPSNLGRVVMLAPAHHGSALMELHRHNPLLNMLYGPALQQSGLGEHCYPCGLSERADYELGIIAGCWSHNPLSFLVLPWPHDGTTTVEDTKLEGMQDHTVIPASHELIPSHPLALLQILHFLKHGRFLTFTENNMHHNRSDNHETKRKTPSDKGQTVTPAPREDPAQREQKKRGQLPLHGEAIGGG